VIADKVDETSKLKPGYNVNLKVILYQKDKVVMVPYEAVIENNEKDMVFIADNDGNVSERYIEKGVSNELYYEVYSGLQAGEKVILSPNQQVKNGIKVKQNDSNK
jgi:HlyD family secretion protein